MTPVDYIAKFKSVAKTVEGQYKIPAIFALAQSALESAWGEKAPGNNMFGVRVSKGWTGESVAITTHEVVNGKSELQTAQPFRAYKSKEDSFLDWGHFLTVNDRYNSAFELKGDMNDPAYIKAFAACVAKAGYSTSPEYLKLLNQMIDSVKKRL